MRITFGWLLGIAIVATLCGIVIAPGGGSTANAGSATSETVAWGDANCDGSVDTLDVLLVLEVTSGLPQSSNECTTLHLGDEIVAAPVFDTGDAQPAAIKIFQPFHGQFGNWDCSSDFNVFDALYQLRWRADRFSGGATPTATPVPDSNSSNDTCPQIEYRINSEDGTLTHLSSIPTLFIYADAEPGVTPAPCQVVHAGDTRIVTIGVNDVPRYDSNGGGLAGFAFNFIYDATVFKVTGMDPQFMLIQGGPNNLYNSSDAIVDTDGDFRVDVHDNAANLNSGDGTLAQITMEAIADGVTLFQVNDNSALERDGKPDLFAANHRQYHLANVYNPYDRDFYSCGTAPVLTLTPTPTPTATPVGQTPGPTLTQNPVVPFVAIDMNIAGNTATSVGTIDPCGVAEESGEIPLDVVVKGVPPSGGISAFSFDLIYEKNDLNTFSHNAHFLLTSQPPSNLADFEETVIGDPDYDDGSYNVSVQDLSRNDEWGDGVLLRIVLHANRGTTTVIGLQNVDLRDRDFQPYDVSVDPNALIRIDSGPCVATPSPSLTPTAIPSGTPTHTPTATPTHTPTGTPSKTPSPTPTPAPHQCPSGSPVTIPDNNPDGASVTRVVTVTGLVSSVAICLNIDHPWIGDLRVTLDNGERTKIVMHRLSGGSGDCEGPGSFHGYVQDTSGNFLDTICPTTYTSYRPLEQFVNGEGSFENEPIAGNWTITVADLGSTNSSATGQITGFEIYLN